MQSSIIENEICEENEADLLQTWENRNNWPEEVEKRQNKLIELVLSNIGPWQATWCAILSIFQCISTLHLFSFVFHVCKFLQLSDRHILLFVSVLTNRPINNYLFNLIVYLRIS